MVIGITHHKSTAAFLPALLFSLQGVEHSLYVVCNNMTPEQTMREEKRSGRYNRQAIYIPNMCGGFDPGAMRAVLDFDKKATDIFMLQETTEVKDKRIFDVAARSAGSVALSAGFFHFLGKYRRAIIDQVGLPIPQTKKAAIFWEYYWSLVYCDSEDRLLVVPNALEDTKKFKMMHGKKRMVLENDYIIKYKSNWGQNKEKEVVVIFPLQLEALKVPKTMSWKPKK